MIWRYLEAPITPPRLAPRSAVGVEAVVLRTLHAVHDGPGRFDSTASLMYKGLLRHYKSFLSWNPPLWALPLFQVEWLSALSLQLMCTWSNQGQCTRHKVLFRAYREKGSVSDQCWCYAQDSRRKRLSTILYFYMRNSLRGLREYGRQVRERFRTSSGRVQHAMWWRRFRSFIKTQAGRCDSCHFLELKYIWGTVCPSWLKSSSHVLTISHISGFLDIGATNVRTLQATHAGAPDVRFRCKHMQPQ